MSGLPQGFAPRCFCCAARARSAQDAMERCDWCGAMWRAGTGGDAAHHAAELAGLLAPGPSRLPAPGERAWFADAFTARIAATRQNLWFVPRDGRFIDGHEMVAPQGTFVPIADAAPVSLTLVTLAPASSPDLSPFLERFAGHFAQTIVALDALDAARAIAATEAGAKVLARTLGGDFAAQRNAAMALVETQWAFHLDLDETVGADVLAGLAHLAACAEAAGLSAVGFCRRNLVDGCQSDLYPDVQYRLVRRGTRFCGPVHERPEPCREWPRTTIALNGVIDHHLRAARLAERRTLYDRLGQDPQRHHDDVLLRTAYRG